MFKLRASQFFGFDKFDEQDCYCTCLRELFEFN